MHFFIGLLVGSLMSWLLDWLVGRTRKQDLVRRLARLEQQEQEWQIVRAQLQQQLAASVNEIQALRQEITNKNREIVTLNELVEEYSIRLDRAETTNQDWMGRWDAAQTELEELRAVIVKGDGNLSGDK